MKLIIISFGKPFNISLLHMKSVYVLLFLVSFFIVDCSIAQKRQIYGTITDSQDGSFLMACNIYSLTDSVGVSSNSYGFYSISLHDTNQVIIFSFIGYRNDTVYISLNDKYLLNIELKRQDYRIAGVDIYAEQRGDKQIGKQSLIIEEIKTLPSVLGTSDLVKSLQLLPGVQVVAEGTSNLSIRGGSHDENLILLDEAPIYNPGHVLNLVSVFNTDAIASVDLFKSFFSAQYGGRLSSVINIRMQEGNSKTLNIHGNIGVVSSDLTLSFPIKKNKTTLLLSGRYGYPGNVLNGLVKLNDNPFISIHALSSLPDDNIVWFYDLNIKLSHIVDKNNRIYLSAYQSRDEFELRPLESNSHMEWGNNTITGRWNHIRNSKSFTNHTWYYSKYSYGYNRLYEVNGYEWNSHLQEFSYKYDHDYFYNDKHHLKWGGQIGYRQILPAEITPNSEFSNFSSFRIHEQQTLKGDIYIEDKYRVNNKIELHVGLRYSSQMNIGEDVVYKYDSYLEVIDTLYYKQGEPIKYYWGLEPRLSLKYYVSRRSSFQLAYGRTMQFIHLLSNSSLGLPTDVWLPANYNINPSSANQVSIGYFHNFKKISTDVSVEVYYRSINNIIDFIDNADLFANDQVESQILPGKRKAYGIEFSLHRNVGKLNTNLSYTYARALQKVDGVNNDKWYPAQFDKPHNLSLSLNYKIFKTLTISSIFKLTSGARATVPVSTYVFNGKTFVEYSDRNAYQFPIYHRLDISFLYSSLKNEDRKWKSKWILGVYNVYNRKNIFVIDSWSMNKIYLYGILPYITYRYEF